MVAPAVDGVDLFKIVGSSTLGWIPSYKTGAVFSVRQPFCSQFEERLLLWLEYNPQETTLSRLTPARESCGSSLTTNAKRRSMLNVGGPGGQRTEM